MTPKTKRTKKPENPAQKLIEALRFVKPCQKKVGTDQQRFCLIRNHWLVASNEILTIGTRVEEDLDACPHTFKLEEALKDATEGLAITQLPDRNVRVASGSLEAFVPCIEPESLNIPWPDPVQGILNDDVKQALATLEPFTVEGGRNAVYSSVMLQANTATATDGRAIGESWHGCELPHGVKVMIPKAAAKVVGKAKKQLTGFGLSESSITFWFEDESFIKTQIFEENYPYHKTCEHLEFDHSMLQPAPENLVAILKQISQFAKDGNVRFAKNRIMSSEVENEGCSHEVAFDFPEMEFNLKLFLQHAKRMENLFFNDAQNRVFFTAENFRGLVMGMEKE